MSLRRQATKRAIKNFGGIKFIGRRGDGVLLVTVFGKKYIGSRNCSYPDPFKVHKSMHKIVRRAERLACKRMDIDTLENLPNLEKKINDLIWGMENIT
jgi:hypothetical protein